MIQIPEQVINEVQEYKNKVQEYRNGNIEAARFKPYRVSMGIYEQRELDTYMVRTRIPGGVVTPEQFKKISQVADKYGSGFIHFTSRQDIQFHKIPLEDTVKIMEELLEVGIITRGTGGNTPRNTGCSPLSGVAKDEIFDVTPYAEATTSYLLKDPTALNLPRKYKIAYSNTPEDTGNATITDLGFIAKMQDGKKGFELYGAGGLGGKPNAGIKLNDFVPAHEVLYHVQAMKELFENEGDRTNKHKARIRFILYRLGEKEFKKVYQQLVKKVKEEKNLDLFVTEDTQARTVGEKAQADSNLLYEQKQTGFYSVYVHPQNGNITTADLNKIITFVEALDYQISIRAATTQGFFVRDLKGKDADRFLELIADFTSPYLVDHSIACAGAATCKLGLCLSQNLLSAIYRRFEKVESEIKSQLPQLFISGCPNSCGQHQKGKIGLSGKAKRVDGGMVPLYTIHFGGNVEMGGATLGIPYGDIPAKKVPEFLYELAVLKHNSTDENFIDFIEEKKERIKALIDKFVVIESQSENPDLYYDFGSEEPFSLKGRGPGECSSGVLDVIQLDLSNAQSSLQEYDHIKDSIQLYQASLSAARALLILNGVDTGKDRIIFKEFIKYFVDTGYVRADIKELIDNLIDYKLGDINSLETYYDDIKYLVGRVQMMYESLSPQLEITLSKEESQVKKDEGKSADQSQADEIQIVDLKGVKCPLNFVKAKIELAKIASGDSIGFYLDDGEPIKNVPKSVEAEGHTIINIDSNYEGYNLLVVKKK